MVMTWPRNSLATADGHAAAKYMGRLVSCTIYSLKPIMTMTAVNCRHSPPHSSTPRLLDSTRLLFVPSRFLIHRPNDPLPIHACEPQRGNTRAGSAHVKDLGALLVSRLNVSE